MTHTMLDVDRRAERVATRSAPVRRTLAGPLLVAGRDDDVTGGALEVAAEGASRSHASHPSWAASETRAAEAGARSTRRGSPVSIDGSSPNCARLTASISRRPSSRLTVCLTDGQSLSGGASRASPTAFPHSGESL